ncbi:PA2928 family protein [Arenimonas sp. MALMAid1274]|uniref:PA2928 family protein n=1 Tax=Arenimonas sp. MALMAid1274 TaxID=3411630 RepID=UPI003BA06B82
MSKASKKVGWATMALCLGLALTACTSSHLEDPQVVGRPAMVEHGGQAMLWVLTKQEESREVRVTSSSRSAGSWRTDTFFHFDLTAYDPAGARPAWNKRLMTLGDDEASGAGPSRVIGSNTTGQLLGQDGDIVWLLIDSLPLGLSATDGRVVADAAALEARNAGLKGVMPRDAKFYDFDAGLVVLAADGRHHVIRGPDLKAADYQPPSRSVPLEVEIDGRRHMLPLRPVMGEPPSRNFSLGGQWIGLFSEKEAADAANDPFGRHYVFPYVILDEGALARRSFWRGRIENKQHFDENFPHIAGMDAIPESPTFIRGRFVARGSEGVPVRLAAPDSVLVWHLTRIDSAGRVALTRLGTDLRTLWTTELPLSESGMIQPMQRWQLAGHLVVLGDQEFVDDGVTRRETYLSSVQLADGKLRSWNLIRQRALDE